MTTCSVIREKLEADEWSALDAAHGMILSAMDDYVEGVGLSLKDPEFWKLCGDLMARAGEMAIKVAKMIGIVVSLLAK